MRRQLLTSSGKRKYLTQDEQERFLAAASELDSAEVRTFCMTLAYTGCRISEALELTPEHIDLSAKAVRFRTLKQRRLKKGKTALLWPISRTMAWKHVKSVMALAGIEGDHATPKGLRHGFGVRMAQKTRNPRLIQKLLGHKYLETTAIYMDLVDEEERAEVIGAW